MKTAAIAITLCLSATTACGSEDPPASAAAVSEAPVTKADAPAPPPEAEVKADAEPGPQTASSPGLIGQLAEAKQRTACTELQMLRSAVEMYTALKGKCPPSLATLQTERVIDRLRDDPWGQAYTLRCSELQLRSAGPDGEPSTPDDVVLGATGDACTAG